MFECILSNNVFITEIKQDILISYSDNLFSLKHTSFPYGM